MIKVFISYSSKNRDEKEQLVSYLKVLESGHSTASVMIAPWDDSQIGIGEEWEKKILDALTEAQIAILLVTADFLTSEFITKNELIHILERQQKNDLIVVPVIARHCAWKQAAWLSKLEVFNKGQVIWDGKREDVEERLAAVTDEVANCAKRLAIKEVVTPVQRDPEPLPKKGWKDPIGFARALLATIKLSRRQIIIGAIITAIFIVSLAGYLFIPRSYKERIKLLLIWPTPQIEGFSDEFLKTEDYKKKWDFSPDEPSPLVNGNGDPKIDGALVVTGGQSALVRSDFIHGRRFYDFTLHFAFRYAAKSSRAGWILHAQTDRQRGYLFELEKITSRQFLLSGVVDDGSTSPSPISGDRSRSIFVAQDVNEDDIINIKVIVSDCTFHYTIWLEPVSGPESDKQTAEFEDEARRFPYGTVGLKESPSNEIIVEFWRMEKSGFRNVE